MKLSPKYNFRKTIHCIIVCLMVFGALYLNSAVANEKQIIITNIRPAVVREYIVVDAQFENLFSPKIISTIQSGLSSLIKIELKLSAENDDDMFESLYIYNVSYNIWDERYLFQTSDTTLVFTDITKTLAVAGRLNDKIVFEKSFLKPDINYQFKMRVQILPISAEQGHKAIEWLQSPSRSGEMLTSGAQANGFQLNVDKMLSFFISRKRRSHNKSEWFKSAQFHLNSNGEIVFK